jgi:hypothetical protein
VSFQRGPRQALHAHNATVITGQGVEESLPGIEESALRVEHVEITELALPVALLDLFKGLIDLRHDFVA